jgi:hypothetical protein
MKLSSFDRMSLKSWVVFLCAQLRGCQCQWEDVNFQYLVKVVFSFDFCSFPLTIHPADHFTIVQSKLVTSLHSCRTFLFSLMSSHDDHHDYIEDTQT